MKPENLPRRALGRGLNTLLPTRPTVPPPIAPDAGAPQEAAGRAPDDASAHAAQNIPIDSIDANPLQPRRNFDPQSLSELAQSIRSNGIIQPLVVRRAGDRAGDQRRYQLVAGERRLRAARMAELPTVPVVILDIPDDHLLEVTLIENIQREDLNPIETAIALSRMTSELHLTAEEVSRRTGKDRTTIINFTRLLQLAPDLQQLVADRQLSAGHARCLLSLPSLDVQRTVAGKAVANGWSVREMERVTRKITEGDNGSADKDKDPQQDPNVKAAIAEMQRVLGTRVRIIEGARHKGKIEIEYYSQEDLDRIYGVIVGEQ